MNNQIINEVQFIVATPIDYPVIQNMARFYVYDLSRECGFLSEDWAIPSHGLYESFDFKNYFEDSSRKVFLVKVNQELAGFVLINQVGTSLETDWNMGEFFILAKFQGMGIGKHIAHQIWNMYPGLWEVSIIPENKKALAFWRRAISQFTDDNYKEEIKVVDYDVAQPKRFIFTLDTSVNTLPKVFIRSASFDDAESIAYVHVKAWQESYKGIIEQNYLDNISFDERLKLRKNILEASVADSIHLVAIYEGQVVGFCDAGPNFTKSNEFLGEVYAIYLLEEYKYLGIGTQLMQKASEHLIEKRLTPFIAWVLEENIIASGFYQKCGGLAFQEKIKTIGSREYKEIAYLFKATQYSI